MSCAAATSSTALATRGENGAAMSGTATATTGAPPARNVRAIAFGTYRSSRSASVTRLRVSGSTWGSSLTTRETVLALTRARAATSRIVATGGSAREVPARDAGAAQRHV